MPLQDWCISRQLWWGHRIPVWYVYDSEVEAESAGAGRSERFVVAHSGEDARLRAAALYGEVGWNGTQGTDGVEGLSRLRKQMAHFNSRGRVQERGRGSAETGWFALSPGRKKSTSLGLRLAKVVESWLPQPLSTRDVWTYVNLLNVQRGAHAPYLS
jgi:hypothetical protein